MIEAFRNWLKWLDLPARPRLLAALSGLLIGLAQPPFGILPGLLGYGLFLWALERDLGPNKKRTAFFMGWLAGFSYFFVGCFWIAEAFLVDADTYGWMAPFAATLLPSGMGLFWGLFAVLYLRFAPKGMKRFLFFACLFCLLELTRGTIMSGFPWDPAGSTWRAGGAMSQMAAYVGVYGLSFITVATFCSIGVARRGQGVGGYAPVIWSVLVLVSCFTLGQVRLNTTSIARTGYIVRIVQPNIGQAAKWTLGNFETLFMSYIHLSKQPPKPGHKVPDLIIWPEGALPFPIEDVMDGWPAADMRSLLHDKQMLIMGTTKQEVTPKGRLVWRNAMMAWRQDGETFSSVGTYSKFKLVPFGEFTPYQDILNPLGMKALTHFDDSFTPGERTKPVSFGTVPRFLPLICYEGIFPSLDGRHYTSATDIFRPKWIVNISNDAWFGPTTGPLQHLNLASYRAIEEGLPMIRSTPTGISVMIDPLGRVVPGEELGLNQRGVLDVDLVAPLAPPPYASQRSMAEVFIALLGLIVMMADTCLLMLKNKPPRMDLSR